MRHFVGQNGQGRHNAQTQVNQKGRSNQDAIAKTVHAVARQNGPAAGNSLGMVGVMVMRVLRVMRVVIMAAITLAMTVIMLPMVMFPMVMFMSVVP